MLRLWLLTALLLRRDTCWKIQNVFFCVKLSINNHIVRLVHKNQINRTCLRYHAACNVEFQSFQTVVLTAAVFQLSINIGCTPAVLQQKGIYTYRVRIQIFLFHFPFDGIYRRLLSFTLGRSVSAWIDYTNNRQTRQHQGKRPTWWPVYVHSLVCLAHVQNDMSC